MQKTPHIESKMIEIVPKSEKKYLKQIEKWLLEEYNNSDSGFYCNWKIIKKSFDQNRIFFLLSNNQTVGFLCWTDWDKVVRID